MRRTIFATWLIIVMSMPVSAQEMEEPDSNGTRLLFQTEKLLEDVTQDATDSQLADLLEMLEENPLDLNYATEAELRQIPGVTQSIADRIIAAREQSRFQSVDEILHIDGMTDDLYQRIRRFTTIASSEISGNMVSGSLRSRTISDLQDRKGYIDGTYRGSSLKSYQRLILNYGEPRSRSKKSDGGVETGFLVEKDAGEARLNDFQAGYAMVNAPEISSKFILGDFVVEAAEGLVLWRSIGFSKGSEVVSTLEKSGGGLRPYLSTDENLFFRGGAFEWGSNGVLLSAFYSNKTMSASINENGMITSFDADGYHRTASEEAKEGNAKESLLGFRTSFDLAQGLSFGATAFQANFSHPLLIGGAEATSGTTMRAGGLDFRYSDRRLTLFSEFASSTSGGIAKVMGLMYQPMSRLDVALVARDYPMDFSNVHSFGFRESSGMTQNEAGVYFGVQLTPAKWLKLSAYYDQFRFPWRTPSLPLPSSGNDFLTLTEVDLSKNLDLQVLYRAKSKPQSTHAEDVFGRTLSIVGQRNQNDYRVTLNYRSSVRMAWRSRFEYVKVRFSFNDPSERGFLYMQDGRYRISEDFTLDGRVVIFQTDSFESRLYEFENDLKGTFANPALYGRGIRSYLLARAKLAQSLEMSAKYTRTVRDGVRVLSSGASEIQGNVENHLSFQFDWRF